eukprot:1083117-Pyramimonas_sp.AAC.1
MEPSRYPCSGDLVRGPLGGRVVSRMRGSNLRPPPEIKRGGHGRGSVSESLCKSGVLAVQPNSAPST